MLTDHKLEEFLFISEGGNRVAYDDFNPRKVLEPGDEIKGTLTYGPGFITRPDGSPVQIGDSMTDQEAYDRIRKYIREVIEPTLEDLIHVPIATSMANALGSLVYNFGATEVYGWKLWGRINSGEPPSNIITEWVTDTYYSKGVAMLGLLRRRFKELALAFGVEWRAGENADWETDPEEFLQVLGWDGTMPKPEPIVDPDLFKELEIPTRGADEMKKVITDPTPNTPITTEDANNMQLESMKTGLPIDYGVPLTPMTNKVPVEAVEYLEPKDKEPGNVTVKRIEKSKRGKGFAKQQTGKELASVGGIGAAAGIVGAAEPVVKVVDKYPAQTLGYVFAGLMLFGLLYYAYGEWQRQRGEDEAEDLLG